MLTGERAFAAASAVETLHAILHVEPPAPSTVVTTLPPTLDVVLRRSLAKSRTDRFQSARDFAFALDLACAAAVPAGTTSAATPSVWRRATLLTAGGVATGALLAVLATSRMSGRDAASPSGVVVEVGALTPLTVDPGYEGQPSFSPDGETVAYVSDRSGDFEIYLQQVSGGPAINLSRDSGRRCPAGDLAGRPADRLCLDALQPVRADLPRTRHAAHGRRRLGDAGARRHAAQGERGWQLPFLVSGRQDDLLRARQLVPNRDPPGARPPGRAARSCPSPCRTTSRRE